MERSSESMDTGARRGRMQELREHSGFTDDDSARLRAAWPTLQRSVPSLIEVLLDELLAHATIHALLAGPTQVEQLKQALARFVAELGQGPHDDTHYQRRREIAGALARLNLPAHLLVVAASRLRDGLVRAARAQLSAADVDDAALAIARACDLELAMMVSVFTELREQAVLTNLRATIVSQLPLNLMLIDADDLVMTSDRASPRVFCDPQPNGKPWRAVLQPTLISAANLEVRFERARQLKREILLPRFDVSLESGVTSFRVTVTPLHHPMAELLVYVDDLTDTIASESRATRAEQLAKLATMAATVAHEIRNPLAGVSAAVQVVAGTMDDDDQRRAALVKVQEQVQRLGNLVGDLLSLSRPVAMNPRETDLAALARSLAATEQGVVEVEGSGAALADGPLLTQVLFNLVQNAWQAGARAVRIEVDNTTLRITDDGPGVPEELREKIFEPFFTTKTRGTGLGLPTARKIVEAMGGTLRLCETPQAGGCFEVQLSLSAG